MDSKHLCQDWCYNKLHDRRRRVAARWWFIEPGSAASAIVAGMSVIAAKRQRRGCPTHSSTSNTRAQNMALLKASTLFMMTA